MYRPENESKVLRGEMEVRDMLYIIGRTVWQLWDDEFPMELRVPAEGMLPPVIEELVRECCSEEVDPILQIVDIYERYGKMLEARGKENLNYSRFSESSDGRWILEE
jgi:hypothetical protein